MNLVSGGFFWIFRIVFFEKLVKTALLWMVTSDSPLLSQLILYCSLNSEDNIFTVGFNPARQNLQSTY